MENKSKARPIFVACIVVGLLATATLAVSWGLFVYQFGTKLASESDQWGIFGDFIGGFVGTIFAALTLGAVAWTLYQQAMHVEEQQRQTREIFLSTQRPWFMVQGFELVGRARVDQQGMRLTTRLQLRNVGNAPALWAFAIPKLALATQTSNPAQEQKSLIMKHKDERERPDTRTAVGQTIFPGAEHVSQVEFGVGADEIADAAKVGPSLHAYILLQITYSVAFDGGRRHLTAMLFEIRRKHRTAPAGRSPIAIFLDEGDVPASELELIAYPIGDYAD